MVCTPVPPVSLATLPSNTHTNTHTQMLPKISSLENLRGLGDGGGNRYKMGAGVISRLSLGSIHTHYCTTDDLHCHNYQSAAGPVHLDKKPALAALQLPKNNCQDDLLNVGSPKMSLAIKSGLGSPHIVHSPSSTFGRTPAGFPAALSSPRSPTNKSLIPSTASYNDMRKACLMQQVCCCVLCVVCFMHMQ